VDPAYVDAHVAEDAGHWYFRGRRTIIRTALRRMLPRRPLRMLEIGCGTGHVLAGLLEFGEVVGVEVSDHLRSVAKARGLDVRKGALPHDVPIPSGWADVVLLLDVLEHLDDDAAGLRAARDVLRPGGALVVTVPAYAWLWSGHDVVLGHRRRYVAGRLRALIEEAGYRVERLSYFNTVLFPAVVATRLYKRIRGDQRHDLHRPRPLVNDLLECVFALERHVVPTPGLPAGTSLFVLGRRRD
jgi:SAM-dependent methyltransferase